MQPSILSRSFFSPARGGHAPGDLRDAFCDAVDAYEAWEDDEPEPKIEVRECAFTVRQVCGLLWNCSDITPGMLYDQVCNLIRWPEDAPKRRTYASCARTLATLYDDVLATIEARP